MANTTEHISIRLPKWLVDELREDARKQQRSLAWILGYRLAQLSNREDSNGCGNSEHAGPGNIEIGTPERTGNRTPVPTVRKAKGKEKRLHPVQPMRDELGRGREHHGQPESRTLEEVHAGHQTYKAGEQQYCSTCRAYF